MPKAKLHWTHDLLAVALVGSVSGLVFWLVPPSEPTKTTTAVNAARSAVAGHVSEPPVSVPCARA